MGLTTIEEFKSKVKGGGYKDRSAASKALGKCKGWKDLDKQQVRNWLDKQVPDAPKTTAPKPDPTKVVKKSNGAQAASVNGKKRGRPRKDPEAVPAVKRMAAKKTAKSGNGGEFHKIEGYLNVMERVHGMAPLNREVQQVLVGGLIELAKQANQVMGYPTVDATPTTPATPRKMNPKPEKRKAAPVQEELLIPEEEEDVDSVVVDRNGGFPAD